MIKRIFILSTLLLYLTTTVGFAMNLHFCGSKVSSISLTETKKSCCAKMAAKPMKCCKDEHVTIKVSDTHQASVISQLKFNSPFYSLKDAPVTYVPIAPTSQSSAIISRGGPPSFHSIPLTVLNCNFRI